MGIFLNIKQMPKYIIQIDQTSPYPFDGVKPHCPDVTIRQSVGISCREDESTVASNIQTLLSLNNPSIIQMTRILEAKGRRFLIDYEYVPQSFGSIKKGLEGRMLLKVKEKLVQLCLELAQAGIKLDIKVEDIGVNNLGEPKLFVPPHFQMIERQGNNLVQEYRAQIEKLLEQESMIRNSLKAPSEISDYSTRLDKKITEIESKINRRKRRRSKGLSHSRQKKTEKAKRLFVSVEPPTIPLSPPAALLDQQMSKASNDDSLTSEQTLYSAVQIEQVKPKTHRASFNDFTTTSHKLNESSRDDSLKRRFEKALEKTQEAFTIYDKYFKGTRVF